MDIKTYNEILKANDSVVVKIGAKWCNPCQTYQPIIDSFAEKNTNITIVNIDADDDHRLAGFLKVRGVPLTLFYKNKETEPYDRASGITSYTELMEKVENGRSSVL